MFTVVTYQANYGLKQAGTKTKTCPYGIFNCSIPALTELVLSPIRTIYIAYV